jgi:hypothetical protein
LEAREQTRTDFGEAQQHSEGAIARRIEQQTARVPSDAFLWAAVAAMGASLFLQTTERKHESLFVGQWVAPFLLFGIYNKIVKVAGSDRLEG